MMKRSKLIFVGAIGLVLLAAVFTVIRLRASAWGNSDDYGPGVKVLEEVIDDGSGPITVRTIFEPSPVLPEKPAQAAGIMAERSGGSLVVGTGDISIEVKNVNGVETVAADHGGPEVTVIVTVDTVIYRDVTETPPKSGRSEERRIQQAVERVDSLDGLPDSASLQVWGQQDGDHVVATVLVFGELR